DTKDAGELGSGHTVTALYEIEPTTAAPEPDWNVMQLELRYKDPDAARSRLVAVPVPARGAAALSQTSDDFRFSAAVAGFGQALIGVPSKTEEGASSLQGLRDLARDARGDDRQCRRAELVGLIERASALRGQPIEAAGIECTPSADPRPVSYDEPLRVSDAEPSQVSDAEPSQVSDAAEPEREREPFDWQRFVLEVLYLLPPLLALPLFVMALRRPRRRRGEYSEPSRPGGPRDAGGSGRPRDHGARVIEPSNVIQREPALRRSST